MPWTDSLYVEPRGRVGLVKGWMGIKPQKYTMLPDTEIVRYHTIARDIRGKFLECPLTRAEAVLSVRGLVPILKKDVRAFGLAKEDNYPSRERIFILCCVAVVHDRRGGATLAHIALKERTEQSVENQVKELVPDSAILRKHGLFHSFLTNQTYYPSLTCPSRTPLHD